MVEKQMMRGAIPVLLLVFGAVAGCTCNGAVAPNMDAGTGDSGPTDSGPDASFADPCAYYYCPPPSSDGGQ